MKRVSLTSIFVALMLFVSCQSSGRQDAVLVGGDTLTEQSQLLTLTRFDNYVVADVNDPWNDGRLLSRYVLVGDSCDLAQLPDGVVVNVPLGSSLVYSSVHAGAINELGCIDAITAVCDAQYYSMPSIVDRLTDGLVVDAGSSMSPDVEKIISHNPAAILCSPFQNAGHGAIERLGIPIIECADYMESSPLGRAEWVKFIGALYGKYDKADSIYNAVKVVYDSLKNVVANVSVRPTVISEMVTDGVWFMPGGGSYMARVFADAGADYVWADDNSTGSLQLDFATVYDRAHDADFWLIKTYGRDLTLAQLESDYALHARMEAFARGGVYSCNTATTSLFEDFPFHPEVLLREYVKIFHGNLLPDYELKYYKPVK